jgi:hypothetical protein
VRARGGAGPRGRRGGPALRVSGAGQSRARVEGDGPAWCLGVSRGRRGIVLQLGGEGPDSCTPQQQDYQDQPNLTSKAVGI